MYNKYTENVVLPNLERKFFFTSLHFCFFRQILRIDVSNVSVDGGRWQALFRAFAFRIMNINMLRWVVRVAVCSVRVV